MDSFPSSGRFVARSLFRMSSHNPLLRLEQRAAEADQIIEYLKQQVQLLKEKASKIINQLIHSDLRLLTYPPSLCYFLESNKIWLKNSLKNSYLLITYPPSINLILFLILLNI